MKYMILLCVLSFSFISYAQKNKTDSLLLLIKSAKTDTARINLMNKVAGNLGQNDLDSAIRYSQTVIAEAKRVNYVEGEAAAHQNLAEALIRKSNFEAARTEIAKAETLARTLKDSLKIAPVYAVYGMMYGMQSRYDSSIFFYKKNIALLENTPDSPKLSRSYQNIAISYQMQSNLRQAVFYQTKALRLAETSHDTSRLAYISVNMGISYELLDDRKRAEDSYLKGVVFAKAAGVKNVELYGYSNLSTFYEKTNYRKAYEYAMKAAALGEQVGDSAILASNLARAGYALANEGNFTEAERLDEKAIAIAQLAGQPLPKFQAFVAGGSIKKLQKKYTDAIPLYEKGFSFLEASDLYSLGAAEDYYELSDCYEKTGQTQQALATYKKATEIKDSANSRENVRKTTELSMQYDFDKEQQLQRAQKIKEDRENTIRLLFLIGFLLVFVTLSTVALFAYRREQKAKKLVNQQKSQIETTLEELKTTQAQLIQSEKMASLGELTAGIAHEIQNPLNFVNNFSDINAELIEELKAELNNRNVNEAVLIADDIRANEEKINHHGKRADAIVKGMLQHSRQTNGAKEPTDINALCDEYLRLSFHGLRAKDKSFNCKLETHFDETAGNISIIPQDIGRVLLNLLNNAFYAVNEKAKQSPESYQPTVEIATKKINDKTEIQIRDNGGGIPQSVMNKVFQPFFTTKPTGEGTGLGLSLSYDIITKEHKGTIRVESEEGKGTRFIIILPQ